MIEFKESKFYKLLQDFFINNDKETFIQFLAEFYNRTEGIINKNEVQDDIIKELREMYIKFNENGIDENVVREKVNYFMENSGKIKDILAKLNSKAGKDEVFSMSNMGQDIKEAMTGGSVAVVGRNAILEENIVNEQVTPVKTDFIDEVYNLLNPNRLYFNKCIKSSQTNFDLQDLTNYVTTFPISVNPNEEITFCRTDNGYGVLFNELDINGKTVMYRHLSTLQTNKVTFTTTSKTRFIMLSFENINIFNICVLAKDSDITDYTPYRIKLKNSYYDDEINLLENKIDFNNDLNNFENFIDESFNLINPNNLINNKCILQVQKNFSLQDMEGYITTKPIKVNANQVYTLKRFDNGYGLLFNELDEKGNTVMYRHLSALQTSNVTFTTTNETKFIMISFPNNESINVTVLAKTDKIEKYEPYRIKLKNSYYDDEINNIKGKLEGGVNINYGEYFSYIKNGFLRCDKTVNGTCLSYNGLDLGSDDKRPYKTLIQLAFENKPNSDSATATIISTKLGMRKVSDITEKSLHLCFGQDSMHADFFENGQWTAFHTYTYSTPCKKDEKTLYTIGWEYINANRIKIYMPDGTSPVIDLPEGKNLSDYCGRYNIFEHFTQNDNGTNKSRALFKKVLIWTLEDTTRPMIYDDFDKPNGSIGVTRSGHTYSQFILNNSDYQTI